MDSQSVAEKNYKFLFEATFDYSSVAMAHVSLDGELIRVNQAICDMLEYDQDELTSKTLEDISHPEDFEQEKHYLENLMAGKIEHYEMEKRYIKADLSTVWGKLSVNLVRDENNDPAFFLGILEDVSDRIQAEKKSDKLSTIVDVQQEVALTEFNIDETIGRIAEASMSVTNADGATVEFEEDGDLVYRGSCGVLDNHVGLRNALDDTISGEAYKSNEVIRCHDTKTDNRIKSSHEAVTIGFRSGLLIPLTYQNKTFGVLRVVSKKPYFFTHEDEKTLHLLAGLLASQIFQSIQFEDTLLRSKTDELTGLSNRRQLMEDMQREIERSSRYDEELSLILLDIDHFKLINDTHGHVIGDRVLEKVGRILTDETRSPDIVGRYGGEEFIILTPEVSQSGAYEVAERIRTRIEKESFVGKESEEFTLTVSAGISVYRNDDTPKTLIDRSDQALYSAKDNGRNQTVLYNSTEK